MVRTMCLAGLALLVGVAHMNYGYDYQKEGYDYDYHHEETHAQCKNIKYNYECTTFRFYNCLNDTYVKCEHTPKKDCGCNKRCHKCLDVSCMKKTPGCQLEGEPGKLCSMASSGLVC